MPTRYIQRRAALQPNDVSRANANAIFVDSDDDQLKFTTGTTGQTTVDLVTESQTQTLTNKTLTAPVITGAILSTGGITNVTTGNLTLTAAAHGGGIITMNDADAGNILTLPDATGSGVRFTVIIGTTVATGTVAIAAPDTDNTMVGTILSAQDFDTQMEAMHLWPTAAASDTITLDGTTTGGRAGDWIQLTDIAADKWHVWGVINSSGTEVTPFSAAV